MQPTGAKSWAVRYRFRDVPRKFTLGSVLVDDGRREPLNDRPVLDTPLTLADARWLAAEALRQVKSGVDPARLKRAADQPVDTVQQIADEYLKRHGHLKSLGRIKYDAGIVCGYLGSRLISDIARLDLVRMLDRIEEKHGGASADRAHAIWRSIANWHASRSEYRPPTVRGKRNKNGARDRVLGDAELQCIWHAASTWPFGQFVRFLLVTASRRDEARCMKCSELVDPATWIIPADRCKSKRAVLIPLSSTAQALLAGAPHIGGELIFTLSGIAPFGDLSNHKRTLDTESGVTGWRLHDLRRTARTLLSRAGVSPDIAERCLGHAIGGVRAVYDRHEFECEKRAAFEALAALVGKIVNRPDGQ